MTQRTWFITGAGRGLGRVFVERVLAHGDRAVATARKPEALARELESYGERAVVLALDVNNSSSVQAAVKNAIAHMGQLDVVVNNAGYAVQGGVEEVSETQIRAQFDTNFFGAIWVTQAVLPHMRANRSGHILQISSIAGLMSSPGLGTYAASKWALEAMSEALAGEVRHLGIRVTIVEPSGFPTDWSGSSMDRATPIADYDDALTPIRSAVGPKRAPGPGDPTLAAQRLIEIVEHPDPPLRLLLGNVAIDYAKATYQNRLRAFAEWEPISRSVDISSG
jgi:NAD(P)-dependent dehydrogenase (short-subunit alcohol dehydrogenase family)